jgi:hypothetical protein
VEVRDLDPIGVAKPYLEAHQGVRAWFGDPGWISDRNEPPYPRLQLLDTPGGTDLLRRWLVGQELTLRLLADPDGTPGKKALRDGMGVILDALRDLPEVPAISGEPVVTDVRFTGAVGYVPEPTGQLAYLARVQIFMHPATLAKAAP